MTKNEAKVFAAKWLPDWTGNNPEKLVDYYSNDVFYLDPGIPNGVSGKNELLSYFKKLLDQNPDWIWKQIEAIPLENGFLNKWLAKIPVGQKTIEVIGICFVLFDVHGKIRRNEVYFDRTDLVAEIYKLKNKNPLK